MLSLPNQWAYPEKKGRRLRSLSINTHISRRQVWRIAKVYVNCIKMQSWIVTMKKYVFALSHRYPPQKVQHFRKLGWACTGAHASTGYFYSHCNITFLKVHVRFLLHFWFCKTELFLLLPWTAYLVRPVLGVLQTTCTQCWLVRCSNTSSTTDSYLVAQEQMVLWKGLCWKQFLLSKNSVSIFFFPFQIWLLL